MREEVLQEEFKSYIDRKESGLASRGTIYCPVEGCEKKYCKKSNLNRHMSRGARRSTARRFM